LLDSLLQEKLKMAAGRARREFAGAKMSGLLDKEEEDEFYTTTYGGFADEADDKEFNYQSPQEDDEVDSDFSIDENDEQKSDAENDDEPRRKIRRAAGVQTKAYKEPDRKASVRPKPPTSKPSRPKQALVRSGSPVDYGRRLTMRASTAQKTSEIIRTMKQRDAEARRRKMKMKKHNKVTRKLTQEEILAEAKVTERINLASLKKYEEMELEAKRKALRAGRREIKGPVIRYHSLATPILKGKDLDLELKPELETDDAEDEVEHKHNINNKQERTLISFKDEETLKDNFPSSGFKIPTLKVCPVTRLPAKYFDPVTELPYANLQAFKIIREAYYQQLEAKGDRSDPEIASWLEWRSKNKPVKPILASINRPPASFASLAAGVNRSLPHKPAPPLQHQQQQQLNTLPVSAAPKQSVVLPTRPSVTTTTTPTHLQTVASKSQIIQVTAGRTIATTTLTAAQLQQLAAARGQVFSALQSQLKSGNASFTMAGGGVRQVVVSQAQGGMRQVTVSQGGMRQVAVAQGGVRQMSQAGVRQVSVSQISQLSNVSRPTQIISGGALVRGQAGLIVSQQPRAQTVTVQRPQVGLVAGRGMKQQVLVATQSPGVGRGVSQGMGRPAPQQLMVATSAPRPRPGQVIMVSTSNPTRQHYVLSTSQSGGSTAQLVALTPGQTVRPGQIVQVAGQPGQHQIVVSQGGQIVLQPPTKQL